MELELQLRRERLTRQAKAKKIRKTMLTGFACVVGIFIIVLTVSTLERLINWHSMELVSVKPGVLEETVKKKSVVVRKERVLTVPNSKSVKYLVEENSRVHVGELLLKIPSAEVQRTSSNSDFKLYAPSAGTVFRKFDGLESVLTPQALQSLNLKSMYDKVCSGTMKGGTQEGEPAIRIVDNLSPVFLCFPHAGLSLKEGAGLQFRVSGSPELFWGTVVDIAGSMVVIKAAPVPKKLMLDRLSTIEVITRRQEGMVVPASSLVKKKGTPGVFAVTAGKMVWTKVTVKGIFDENAVVTGVEVGQEVVANPETI